MSLISLPSALIGLHVLKGPKLLFFNNYNCRSVNLNVHLIVLTCISFFNDLRFVFMRGGGNNQRRTSFVILCNASMKRNGQSATS